MDNKTHLQILWNTELKNCTKCRLYSTRTQVVPGEGNANAEIMIIGQNPGFNEDKQGRPFIGKSGVKLNELLSRLGINRNDVYITNVAKCFTTGNRKPELDELKACNSHLKFELRTLKPKVLIALGEPAIFTLTGFKDSVTKAMNTDLKYKDEELNIPVIGCYHPSYLCRMEYTNIIEKCVKVISTKLRKINWQ